MTCSQFETVVDDGGSCPGDTTGLTSLVQEMRAAFGPDKIITVASQAGAKNYAHFDLKGMDQYVSYWHAMTCECVRSGLVIVAVPRLALKSVPARH